MVDSREPVTVFLPTWNAGERLEEVLDALRMQRTQRKVFLRAIDSGSSDGTRERLALHGATVAVIAQREFDHGLTRNRGVLESTTELVALLSQDARPADEHWLEELLAPFADARVAGTWARQVPRPGCHPFQRSGLAHHMASAEARAVLEPLSAAAWTALPAHERAARLLFDDVSSAVRRSVVERIPFPQAKFAEDIAWARAVLLAGHRLAFASRALVEHSHEPSASEFYERCVQTHAAKRRLADLEPLRSPLAALRAFTGTARAFLRAAAGARDLPLGVRVRAAFQAVPYAALQTAATRRGARSASYEAPRQAE